MSATSTREVVARYLQDGHSDVSMLSEDVTFTDMASGQVSRGREEVRRMLEYVYSVAFEARGDTRNLICDEGHAVWEGHLVGKHTGTFAGVPATGKSVCVPLCVVYDLQNDQITKGRIYFDIPVLYDQLGMEMATASG